MNLILSSPKLFLHDRIEIDPVRRIAGAIKTRDRACKPRPAPDEGPGHGCGDRENGGEFDEGADPLTF
jgi:hypothetical protein